MPSEWQLHGKTQYSWKTADGTKNLRLTKDVQKPTTIPKDHSLVRIKAAALNAADMMVISHDPVYPGPHLDNLVPCVDGAGIIEEVSEGSKWKAGDRVVINANSWLDWSYQGDEELPDFSTINIKGGGSEQGILREYGVFPDAELIAAPANLSYAELAALPAAGGTAAHALFFGPRPIKTGQTVLTQGTGGVSCFAIQLASAVGATVIATSSSDDKLNKAKKMGAKHLINYRTSPNWEEDVLKVTNGKGVDMVIEVGGSSTIEKSLASTKHGGTIAMVGVLSAPKASDLTASIIFGGKTIYGVLSWTREMTAWTANLLGEKNVKPKVGKVFAWEDAPKAFEELARGGSVGKIVITVGSD